MKLHFLSRAILCFTAFTFMLSSVSAADPAPVRMLFAGSSSTYWNDLPREVAKVTSEKIVGHIGTTVIPEIVGRSGSDIRVYAEPDFTKYEYGVKSGQSFLDKLREEKPTLVVLQAVCNFVMDANVGPQGGNAHAEALTHYCEVVRAAGGEPVIYEMGWGKSDKLQEGQQRLFDIAVKNKIRFFSPCSTAWTRVYRERPDLALQHPQDNSHPGDNGHFLNLACFYASLTQQSPVGKLPRTFHVWPHGKYEADEAKLAAFKPDAYQATLSKWMFKHMSMNATATLDDATASYLESVAWETWQKVDRRLKEAINKP
jgi:hypothetical protein